MGYSCASPHRLLAISICRCRCRFMLSRVTRCGAVSVCCLPFCVDRWSWYSVSGLALANTNTSGALWATEPPKTREIGKNEGCLMDSMKLKYYCTYFSMSKTPNTLSLPLIERLRACDEFSDTLSVKSLLNKRYFQTAVAHVQIMVFELSKNEFGTWKLVLSRRLISFCLLRSFILWSHFENYWFSCKVQKHYRIKVEDPSRSVVLFAL